MGAELRPDVAGDHCPGGCAERAVHERVSHLCGGPDCHVCGAADDWPGLSLCGVRVAPGPDDTVYWKPQRRGVAGAGAGKGRERAPAVVRAQALAVHCARAPCHPQAGQAGPRALKPSNILMMMGSAYSSGSQPGTPTSPGLSESSTRLNGVVLTDTALNGIKSNMGTMTVVPSVAYMAPENLQGLDGGCAADIFVMGTLIYELTTGKYAFYGHNAMDVGHQILAEIEDPAVVALIERCWVV